MTIQVIGDKIKGFFIAGWGREILLFLLFGTAVYASFLLGKSTKIASVATPVLIEVKDVAPAFVQQKSNVSTGTSGGSSAGGFVAAKSGAKYYPTGCGSANRIKPENKVYFTSEAEAQSAGYTRSTTCK